MTNTSNRKTARERALTAFKSGYDFTPNQLATRLGTSEKAVRKIVNELRLDGYPIYKNNKKTSYFGDNITVYRLGTPSREMVALAAAVGGSELFS